MASSAGKSYEMSLLKGDVTEVEVVAAADIADSLEQCPKQGHAVDVDNADQC